MRNFPPSAEWKLLQTVVVAFFAFLFDALVLTLCFSAGFVCSSIVRSFISMCVPSGKMATIGVVGGPFGVYTLSEYSFTVGLFAVLLQARWC